MNLVQFFKFLIYDTYVILQHRLQMPWLSQLSEFQALSNFNYIFRKKNLLFTLGID